MGFGWWVWGLEGEVGRWCCEMGKDGGGDGCGWWSGWVRYEVGGEVLWNGEGMEGVGDGYGWYYG